MSSIVVFSKDRPMQLHAYLESLFLFSDAEQQDVTVLYCESEKIDYQKTKETFPKVTWRRETHFHSDLEIILEGAEEYILFGCDDVVFTRAFSLCSIEDILQKNNHVFGYSLRLGANICPAPFDTTLAKGYRTWKWTTAKEKHYGYPWELDCTVYRKNDVLGIIAQFGEEFKNPNFLEEGIARNPQAYVNREWLACSSGCNHVVVITVNRVQDTHKNPVDESKDTDPQSLNEMYNSSNMRLDVMAIAALKSNKIHVGSKYFLIKEDGPVSALLSERILRPRPSFKTFFKNLRYMFMYNVAFRWELDGAIDNLSYEISDEMDHVGRPRIKTATETISEVLRTGASLCRFGDGEFIVMGGGSIGFQEADQKLAQRLKEIIVSKDEGILVGIPYPLYHSVAKLQASVKIFYRTKGIRVRKYVDSVIDSRKEYVDTCCSQLYTMYGDEYDFAEYFNEFRSIWRRKDITIICGENVFKNIRYNIFENAKTIEYQFAPSVNAFREYPSVLGQALQIDKSRLVIIILGPTATVLAYDLAKHGYRALDFGHIGKSYDWYHRNTKTPQKISASFFLPD